MAASPFWLELGPALLEVSGGRGSLITAPPPLRGAGCLPICDFVLEEDEGPTSIRKLNRTRECAVPGVLYDLALAETAKSYDFFQSQHLPRHFFVLYWGIHYTAPFSERPNKKAAPALLRSER